LGFLASYYFTIREENINRSRFMTNIDYAAIQNNIANAYLGLSELQDREENLIKAEEAKQEVEKAQ
jgi:hypothetical protein